MVNTIEATHHFLSSVPVLLIDQNTQTLKNEDRSKQKTLFEISKLRASFRRFSLGNGQTVMAEKNDDNDESVEEKLLPFGAFELP